MPLDHKCVAIISSEITTNSSTSRSIGSGYLISSQINSQNSSPYVITALHVVFGADFINKDSSIPTVTVKVAFLTGLTGQPKNYSASPIWYNKQADICILKLSENLANPVTPNFKFGQLSRDTHQILSCRACGFPKASQETNPDGSIKRYISAGLYGTIDLDGEVNTGLFPIALWPGFSPSSSDLCKGFSGSAVFVQDFLVGIITLANSSYSGSRLTMFPISSLFLDPSFLNSLGIGIGINDSSLSHVIYDAQLFTQTPESIFIEKSHIKATVSFILIEQLNKLSDSEVVDQLAKLNQSIKQSINKFIDQGHQNIQDIDVLSTLLGAIIISPDPLNLGDLPIKLLMDINKKMLSFGIHIKAGMSWGDVQPLLDDIRSTINYIGLVINDSAYLAFAQVDNHPGLFIHKSLADHIQPFLTASHWLFRTNPNRLSRQLTIKKKTHNNQPSSQETIICFYPPKDIWPTSSDISYQLPNNFSVSSQTNSVIISYRLPNFNYDFRELSQQFKTTNNVFSILLKKIKHLPEYFYFSPGGDSGVIAFPSLQEKEVYDLAKDFATNLATQLGNVECRVGLHYGSISLYHNYKNHNFPTGFSIFVADELLADECSLPTGILIFTDTLKNTVCGGNYSLFNTRFFPLPNLPSADLFRYSDTFVDPNLFPKRSSLVDKSNNIISTCDIDKIKNYLNKHIKKPTQKGRSKSRSSKDFININLASWDLLQPSNNWDTKDIEDRFYEILLKAGISPNKTPQNIIQKLEKKREKLINEHPNLREWILKQFTLLEYGSPIKPPEDLTDIAHSSLFSLGEIFRTWLLKDKYITNFIGSKKLSKDNIPKAENFLKLKIIKEINTNANLALECAARVTCRVLAGFEKGHEFKANLMIPFSSSFDSFGEYFSNDIFSERNIVINENIKKAQNLWNPIPNSFIEKKLLIVMETKGANHLGFWVPVTNSHNLEIPGAPYSYSKNIGTAVFKDDLPILHNDIPAKTSKNWYNYMQNFQYKLFVSLPFSLVDDSGVSRVVAVLNVNAIPYSQSNGWRRAYYNEWLNLAQYYVSPFVNVAFHGFLLRSYILNTPYYPATNIEYIDKIQDRLFNSLFKDFQ